MNDLPKSSSANPDHAADTHDFTYRFKLPDGSVKQVAIKLDARTLTMIPKQRDIYPEWTILSHSKCGNCTLKESTSPRCPVAVNLVDLISLFYESASYDRAVVEVTTPERTYVKEVSMADGISSLIGIYMVTSGCPILGKFKPMVRTHLPFSSWEETLYRTLCVYLLAQYFIDKAGKTPDWSMKNIQDITEEINTVNSAFCARLKETHLQDASLNAVIRLDCFATMTSGFLCKDRIDELKPLFDAYLT
ncbi:MAG: hypothetical protein AAB268_13590 [Elusimicrobiota bacterium]